MPRNKDLKRLVRSRMTKTGEAYTAARSQVVKKPRASARAAVPAPVAAAPPPSPTIAPADYASIAGKRDDVIKARTGCSWERWVHALDRRGALDMSHREIATLVREKYKIEGWWAQTVAVGYERIKGLRAVGQRRDGKFEASKSRTFGVPVTTLFEAWSDARRRQRWLDRAGVKVRGATPPKSLRLDWDDGTIVVAWFAAKGPAKSTVSIAHTKLPDKGASDRLKQYWSERLDALGEVLAEPSR